MTIAHTEKRKQMSRYINADKTLTYISHLLGGLPLALLNECEKNGIDIVRCKECKYATKRLNNDYLCTHHGKDWNYYDHFCSYGEYKGGLDD